MQSIDQRLIRVRPTERQLRTQEMGFYAFVHFTVNTFTDREWGDGTESPALFNPTKLNPAQWVEAIKAAGMTGLILTCKHHDGFCLWPSRHTEHTVVASPCPVDVVAETARACKAGGIRFGVYLSPWDRHHPLYGMGKPYDDYFIAQLTELLTGYGDIFAVWLDGACGEGPNGKKQVYDWDRYYAVIRCLQPDACIHVCGPDIRWCGNEAGHTRPSEWCVVPRRTADTEKIAADSQQADDAAFRQRTIRAWDHDLGSRAILADEEDLIWYPAEVNTSIRPGWFWHASEDDQVKPLEKLLDIYEKSVGGNAMFLLNIPPTKEGLFHANDVRRLRELGQELHRRYSCNLLESASLEASAAAAGHGIENTRTADESYYLPACEDGTATLILRWQEPQTVFRIVLKEQLRLSQRVEAFAVDGWLEGDWVQVAGGTVIGSGRIVTLPKPLETTALRIRITDARVAPTLRFLGVYGI